MKNLTPPQLTQLRTDLHQAGATLGQANTLLPLFAQEVEHYMWIGLPFEAALHKVHVEADFNPLTYLREKHGDMLVLTEDEADEPDMNDIVFADRNRAYGAYDLRRAYNIALVNAFVMAIGIVLLGLSVMDAWQRGEWIYLSWSGLAWIAGILLVTLAGFRFYVENQKHQQE